MDGSDTLKEISRHMPSYVSVRFSEDLEFLKCADLVTITVFRKQLLKSKRMKTIVILWFWHPIVCLLSEWMVSPQGFFFFFFLSVWTRLDTCQSRNVIEVSMVLFRLKPFGVRDHVASFKLVPQTFWKCALCISDISKCL